MNKTIILFYAALIFSVFGTYANNVPNTDEPVSEFSMNELQQNRVSGTITDEKGNPVPGVTIMIKGSTIGSITDALGKYIINDVPKNAILVFSFIGMKSEELPADGRGTIDLVMKEDVVGLEEVVVIGYGTQKRTTLTGSVSVTKGEEVASVPVANITNTLAGRLAGVSMKPVSGQPGKDSPNIYIRGIATTGSNSPLIVIDGVIRSNISQIDPSIIESISVLKDAAAVAPYGLAGANGVILISTKKGVIGKPTLSIDSYYGWTTPTYVPNILSAKDYMILQNEAYLNDNPGGTNFPWTADLINNYEKLHAEDPDRYGNSNTVDLMNMNAPVRKHNMQVSGGFDKVKYFAGLGYYKQEGLFDRTNYRRYNYNLNMDFNVTNTTLISVSVTGSEEKTNDLDPQATGSTIFRSLYKYYPTVPMFFSNGFWSASAANSPAGIINSKSYNVDNGSTILSSISVEQQLPFIKGLSFKGSFSYDTRDNSIKGWHTPWYYWTVNYNTTPYTYTKTAAGLEGVAQTFLQQTHTQREYFTYQGMFNYSRTFGNSLITGLFVAEARDNTYNSLFARRNNFAVSVDELDMGSSDKIDFDNNGSSSVGAQIGYVYRFGYTFKDRYMLEATGRYDGHYYFAPGKRWGYFPAFSAGWRLSEENFMKNLPYINNLKIRGSWGKSGNLAGSAYQYLSGYTLAGNGYAFGTGKMVQRAYNALEANPNITWERSTKTNLGFEATLWNSLLMVEADYFFENRTGMLLSPAVTVPYEYGLSLAQENAGEMNNKGFELRLGSRKSLSNGLTLEIDGNISYTKNKMVQVFETSATYDNLNRRRTGKPYLTPFGYKSLGLFRLSDDKNGDGIINATDGYNVTQFGTLHPGDIKYADLSGPDGKPDGKIDGNDETALGDPTIPLLTYGFTAAASWKGFDLNLFMQGAGMVSLDIGTFETVAFENNKSNCEYEYFNNRWNVANDASAIYPRANTSPTANNTQITDFWIMNAAYLRLKTAILGYTIPAKVTESMNIKNIRVYFSGQNLITFSKLKFKDPETAAYGSREAVAYPNMMTYTFGANITF
jgi:TonB-linked SusC/RagA family outer membrane protein